MFVKDIMTKPVVTVDPYDFIHEVKHILENVTFHHILVIEKKKLIGVISDRDYLKAISPFISTDLERSVDKASLNRRVHQIMSRKPITVTGKTSMEAAAKLLLKENISCLPVVTETNEVEGIITWKDILKCFLGIKKKKGVKRET